jgi:hypothetical protein
MAQSSFCDDAKSQLKVKIYLQEKKSFPTLLFYCNLDV